MKGYIESIRPIKIVLSYFTLVVQMWMSEIGKEIHFLVTMEVSNTFSLIIHFLFTPKIAFAFLLKMLTLNIFQNAELKMLFFNF